MCLFKLQYQVSLEPAASSVVPRVAARRFVNFYCNSLELQTLKKLSDRGLQAELTLMPESDTVRKIWQNSDLAFFRFNDGT